MKKSISLFLDTTNNYCYLALYRNNDFFDELKLPVNKNVTDLIVLSIKKLLLRNKILPMMITSLYLNIGPGSFTGIKVGVVIAKAWKLIYPKISVLTINSLLLQANSLPSISVIDAKSKKIYLAVYGIKKVYVKPKIIFATELKKYLSKYKNFHFYCNNVDMMYSNFLLHKPQFEKIREINKLIPLYLKSPI